MYGGKDFHTRARHMSGWRKCEECGAEFRSYKAKLCKSCYEIKRMQKNKLSEKQIQRQVLEILNYNGCFMFRMNSGMIPVGKGKSKRMIKLGSKGTADLLGIRRRDGKFIAVEIKTPKRRSCVTFHQKQFLEQIKEYGGIAGVATSPEEALEIVNSE